MFLHRLVSFLVSISMIDIDRQLGLSLRQVLKTLPKADTAPDRQAVFLRP